MSYLPVCHILERFYLYLCQYYGVSIYFGESIDKIGDNLKEVKPNLMTGVPRVLEKVYDKIYAKGLELKGLKKMIFFWALNLGFKFKPYNENGWWYEFQLKIARKLIFSKWKEGLGGNLNVMVSGSAALQHRLIRVFAAAGMPVMEGYGLTETSPVITVNDQRNGGFRVGTVGRVINNVAVKIAEDGEILCKGPNVMMGYYKDQQLTDEVIKNGYFHTGDIGEIDKDGFLKITDRKKEMFKTSGGKYIAPQLIENAMKQSLFIEQIMVIGDGGRLAATVVTPLSVVLTELLQNAVDHGFPEGDGGGNVAVRLHVEESELEIAVIDDGRGIPAGFKLADAKGLGLSIVRTLVTTELAGTIEMRPAHAEELAEVEFVPRDGNTGTVILLRVPLQSD
jgi:long-chain acyl-CoA synthetase